MMDLPRDEFGPAMSVADDKVRWFTDPPRRERELCRQCGGNGVVNIPGGITICPRCDQSGWEPAARCPQCGHSEPPRVSPGRPWELDGE